MDRAISSFAPTPIIIIQRNKFPPEAEDDINQSLLDRQLISRAHLFECSSRIIGLSLILPGEVYAKCTDIESCREEGERKIEADLKLNPIIKLSGGVRYRVLQPSTPLSGPKVKDGSTIDLIYSISTAYSLILAWMKCVLWLGNKTCHWELS